MNKEVFFETIKCDDYEVYNLEFHNKRVANTIAMNLNLQEYIYPITSELLRCKLVYDDSCILDVKYFPYKKREIKTFKLIYDNNIDYSKKYFDRSELDELYEKRESCNEIIIIKNDLLSDTSIANIAIYYENMWITPKLPLLYGTTRARLLEERVIIEKDITVEMLKKSTKLALMNAMIDFDEIKDYSFFS